MQDILNPDLATKIELQKEGIEQLNKAIALYPQRNERRRELRRQQTLMAQRLKELKKEAKGETGKS